MSIHLVRAGLRVLCVEAAATGTDAVRESLDWLAPALPEDSGLPMDFIPLRQPESVAASLAQFFGAQSAQATLPAIAQA